MATSLSENVSPVLSSRLEFGQSPHENFDLLSKIEVFESLALPPVLLISRKSSLKTKSDALPMNDDKYRENRRVRFNDSEIESNTNKAEVPTPSCIGSIGRKLKGYTKLLLLSFFL